MTVGGTSIISACDASAQTVFSSTSQCFFSFTGGMLNSQKATDGAFTEAQVAITFRTAGTMTLLQGTARTAATGTSTVRLRQNSANATNTFSIGSGQTGSFSDTTPHIDTIVSGDNLCIGITAGSTALVIYILGISFTTTLAGNTVSRLGNAWLPSSTAAGTYFATPIGVTAINTTPSSITEANTKLRINKPFTVSNLCISVFQMGSGSASYTSRKNGANGNLTISVGSNSTGILEDTTPGHSDSLAIGDDYNYTYHDGTSSGNFFNPILAVADWTSTNGDSILCMSEDVENNLPTSVTEYGGICGNGLLLASTQETNTAFTANSNYLFSLMTCDVISNGITATSTILLRVNGANPASGPVISIGSQQTGIVKDSTGSYQASISDVINYRYVTGSTGSSNLKFTALSIIANITTTGTSGPTYQHFGTNSAIVGAQYYQSFGSQMVVFGY